MADARATVVACEEEPLNPEILHDIEHVFGQDTGAVIDVIGAGVGQRTVAIAAQIGENYMLVLRKPRSDAIPRRVVLRIAVQEQKWWAGTAVAQPDHGAVRAHVEMLESREQSRDFRAAPARRVADIICACRFGQHSCLLRRCWR